MARFLLGVGAGAVGSFYVLREVTERRLVTWKRPDAGLSDSFVYHRRLQRMLLEEQRPKEEDGVVQKLRLANNSLVRSLAGKSEPDDLTIARLVDDVGKALGLKK